jgi:hypothetical protein
VTRASEGFLKSLDLIWIKKRYVQWVHALTHESDILLYLKLLNGFSLCKCE